MEKTTKRRHQGRSIVLAGIVCIAIIAFFAIRIGINVVGGVHAAATCNVETYGATGNGSTVNNMTASGASTAGYIVGVPEKPFTAITLNAVKITAKTGLEVRNAAVTVTG